MSSIKPLWLVGLCILGIALCAIPLGCQKSQPPRDSPQYGRQVRAERHQQQCRTSRLPNLPPGARPRQVRPKRRMFRPDCPPLPVPDDNPMTAEKNELGRLLYFDKRLSKDKTIACFTCHDPDQRLGGTYAHQHRDRRAGRRPKLAHRDQRRLRHFPVLGRPDGNARTAGSGADREPPSKWVTGCPTW